ncbi:hypothetical protein J3F84DRAFT_374893 [Trichoderma pleuroticola]
MAMLGIIIGLTIGTASIDAETKIYASDQLAQCLSPSFETVTYQYAAHSHHNELRIIAQLQII